jgi:glucose/arabinose dehydrogenase
MLTTSASAYPADRPRPERFKYVRRCLTVRESTERRDDEKGTERMGGRDLEPLSCGMSALARYAPVKVIRAGLWRVGMSALLLSCDSATDGTAQSPNVQLSTDVVATGLDTVWELVWGPDGFIWMTERGGRVSRVNPQSGAVTVAGQIAVSEIGEGGLMGLALHPDFASQPWVYLAHTYSGSSGVRNRVVRARFDGTALGTPEVLLADIPGSSIHNGARLAIGPDRLLYITTGDASDPTIAQNRDALAGKVLRLTLDGLPAPGNPFNTRIYSYGHRNPQGMTFAPNGSLYITEHGPADNDEVNRIEAGRNYGWPTVHGRCDGDIGIAETSFCSANAVAEPIAIWTPTIAPAGLAWYDASLIPGFRGSLLFATLKDATLYRLALSSDGKSVRTTEKLFDGDFGRLRAVLVAPDGAIYLGTSNRDGRGSPASTDDRIIRIRPR